MSTDLEHDLRAAFDELAATTTVSPTPRFGDITTHPVGDPRRSRSTFLAAVAVVLALVGGLALLVRNRTGEAPAPAATTAPVAEPAFFLFPDVSGDVRFDDPRDAVDAYLADRVATSPPGQTVTYTVSQVGPPFDGSEDQVLIGFSLTVTPDDPALCCDSGDGVASVALVDGAWFVTSAATNGFVVEVLRYSDGGVVEAAYRGRAGGIYTMEIDDFGFPGPEENGCIGDQPPDPQPGNTATCRVEGHTAPAVAVRFWHSPNSTWPTPSAAFAEFIVPRGAEAAPNVSLDDSATPATTAPPIAGDLSAGMLSASSPTPMEAVEGYLIESTEGTSDLVRAGVLDDVPSASVAPTGRLYTFAVAPTIVQTSANEAWVRFDLASAGGSVEGIARVVDIGWAAGTPAWTVSFAGTRGVALASATYRDGTVSADFSTTEYMVLVRALDGTSGTGLEPTGSSTVMAQKLGDPLPTMALTLWAEPGDAPAFAEVLISDGGESEPVDFGALLDSLFGQDVQVTVPSFIGLTEGQARDLADDLGLTLDVATAPAPAGDPTDGTVVAQGFADGTTTVRGTAVTITVAEAEVG